MTQDKQLKAAARERAEREGISYTQARAAVLADLAQNVPAADPVVDPVLLAPYPDEDDVSAAELGWRVLPADASPADRARAEATWRPVDAGRVCRCSGQCRHGQGCPDEACDGLLVHVDRYPGSLWSIQLWEDLHVCDTCEDETLDDIELPLVPWGEVRPNGESGTITAVYEGTRHPVDADDDDEGDGVCRRCGGYAMEGLYCDPCAEALAREEDPQAFFDADECEECGGLAGDYDQCVCQQ